MNELQKAIKQFLENHYKCDVSDVLVERVYDVMENEVDECPVCGKRFHTSESALQYQNSCGMDACECQSPENIAAARADMEIDLEKEGL